MAISRKNLSAFFFVSLSGAAFACYLKLQNLLYYSPALPSQYPLAFWGEAIGAGILLACILFLAERLILSFLLLESDCTRVKTLNSLTYACVFLIFFQVRIEYIFLFFLIGKIILLFPYRKQLGTKLRTAKMHLFALLAISLSQAVFIQMVSPNTWDNPLSAIKKDESTYIGPSSTSQLIQYHNAKRYDFSGFDHSHWGSMPFGATSGRSYLAPLLVNLFDLPVIDTETQVRLWLIIALVWMILSSYCFYFYLHQALQISAFSALIGGICFTISNAFLAEQFTYHFPMFFGPFLMFPVGLWIIRNAFAKSSWKLGFFSGAVFSLHLYAYQSHPDTVIHSTMLWLLYGGFHLFFNRESKINNRIKILLSSAMGFGLGALFVLSPILEAVFSREMQVVGHSQGIYLFYGKEMGRQFVLNPILWISLLFLFTILPTLKKFRSKSIPLDFIFYFTLSIVLLFSFLPGNDGPVFQLISKLQIQTLNFRQTSRILMYLSFSLLVLLSYGLDWYFEHSSKKKTAGTLAAVLSSGLLGFYVIKKYGVYKALLPGAGILLFLLAWYGLKTGKNKLKLGSVLPLVIFILLQYGSLNWLGEPVASNPGKCKPYITLESLLTKLPLFPEDIKQSETVIQKRLFQFEKDWGQSRAPLDAVFKSKIKTDPINEAKSIYPEIDHYYLKDQACIHPVNKTALNSTDQIAEVHYNLMGIFKGLENPYSYILNRTAEISTHGIGQGLLIQNTGQSFDPQIMKVFPPINALYAIPGEYFLKMGGYGLIPRVFKEGSEIFSDHKTRKMYNIGGLQLFLIKESDAKKIENIEGIEILKNSMSPITKVPYLLAHDHLAYNTAYLASQIEYISPEVNHFEEYKFPFHAEKDGDKIAKYKEEVDFLHNKLLSLPEKHSIYLEDSNRTGRMRGTPKNSVKILNIFGSGAAFQTHCESEPCQLVYNTAALRGWQSFVNGVQAPIQKANFAFLSVPVSKGETLVWFEYRPLLVVVSLFLTLAAFLFIFAVLSKKDFIK